MSEETDELRSQVWRHLQAGEWHSTMVVAERLSKLDEPSGDSDALAKSAVMLARIADAIRLGARSQDFEEPPFPHVQAPANDAESRKRNATPEDASIVLRILYTLGSFLYDSNSLRNEATACRVAMSRVSTSGLRPPLVSS